MSDFNFLSGGGYITSLAAIITALGLKELILDRFHRKDNLEDRNLKQMETLESLQKGYESNRKLIESLTSSVDLNAKQISSLVATMDKLASSFDNLQELSKEGDLSILRERLYYVYSAAIQCGFRTSVGFGISEKMFSCYTKLGGNSEIAALRDIYVDLPLRQSGMIIPKYEGVSDADTVSK